VDAGVRFDCGSRGRNRDRSLDQIEGAEMKAAGQPDSGANDEQRGHVGVPVGCPRRAPRHGALVSLRNGKRMRTLIAVLTVSSLSLVLAGAIVAVFGQKSGAGALLILMFVVSYSRRIGAAKKWET